VFEFVKLSSNLFLKNLFFYIFIFLQTIDFDHNYMDTYLFVNPTIKKGQK
jgi:hypothetical protein